MKTIKNKLVNGFIITTFVALYLLVSIISTIHVIDFFKLSNPEWLAISLAIGFELGAAASLASLIVLDKMNKTMVWALFIVITAMQMQGNMYYAFVNLQDYQGWVELFNLVEWEPLAQKRLLAAVSGAILPLVALGFIKSLVDYIKPEKENSVMSSSDLEEVVEEINHKSEKKTKIEFDPLTTTVAGDVEKSLVNNTEEDSIELDWIDVPEPFATDEELASIEKTESVEKQRGAVEDQFEQRVVRYFGTELKNGFRDEVEEIKVKPSESNENEA